MNAEEYDTHLKEHLCWICHKPTHKSHALQRQCPQCRKKWSYHRREQEWLLIREFSLGRNSHETSKLTGISYHTALSHFRKNEAAIRQYASQEKHEEKASGMGDVFLSRTGKKKPRPTYDQRLRFSAKHFLDFVIKKKGEERKIVPERWSRFGIKLLFDLVIEPSLPKLTSDSPSPKPTPPSDASDYMVIS